MTMLEALKIAASPHNLQVVERGKGHFQIHGKGLLVNYYPDAKNRSAYVAGTTKRFNHVTPAEAIKMALEPPPIATADRKVRRAKTYRPIKMQMFESASANGKKVVCHWCKIPLTLETATMEHKIPLALGGLDNGNNRVLACKPCNSKRGHTMPELGRKKAV